MYNVLDLLCVNLFLLNICANNENSGQAPGLGHVYNFFKNTSSVIKLLTTFTLKRDHISMQQVIGEIIDVGINGMVSSRFGA